MTPGVGRDGARRPVEKLTVGDWGDKAHVYEEIINPSWGQVEAAIRALNNRERNDIYLTPSESNPETYLAVGGGDGRYFVTGSIDNELFPTMVDPEKAEREEERLITGGQEIEIPGRWVVDLETALRAVGKFYEAGDFNCGVDWQFA